MEKHQLGQLVGIAYGHVMAGIIPHKNEQAEQVGKNIEEAGKLFDERVSKYFPEEELNEISKGVEEVIEKIAD